MKKLAIAFAFDEKYLIPFVVTVESLLDSKKDDVFYDIFCLLPCELSEERQAKVQSLHDKYKNFNITYINLKDEFKDKEMRIKHISYVTYYRLKLPEILPQYDVCLYLDVDIIVNHDISELWDLDLKDNLVAAVPHAPYYSVKRIRDYKVNDGEYFNAGVLLLNLAQMREEKTTEKFTWHMRRSYKAQDQDILNIVCSQRVLFLDMKYNVASKVFNTDRPLWFKHAKIIFGKNAFKSAIKDPSIIHYADKEKPWDFLFVPYGKEWRKMHKKSIYKDTNIRYKVLKSIAFCNNFYGIFHISFQKRTVIIRMLGFTRMRMLTLQLSLLNIIKTKIVIGREQV